MKAAILSGSSRSTNNTLRVAKAIEQALIQKGITTDIVDFRSYDMPFFNGEDVNPETLTEFQKNLVSTWNEADIVYVVSPEYNWFPSAELVNMVHQLGNPSFSHLFDKKVFAFAGVSSGRGGRLPGMHLSFVFEKLISHLNVLSICSPAKFESHYSPREVSESGDLKNEGDYKDHLMRFIDFSTKLSLKFK
jgi:chromate reductase, NAD(P)H dehydrogenase (quinone)